MQKLTEQFVDALADLHSSGDVEPLAALFADDATLSKAGMKHEEHGQGGARAFWSKYRGVFDTIESSFQRRVCGDAIAFLEWSSSGTLLNGNDFRYGGVSVLEGHDDKIKEFRTYYDTTAFSGGTGKAKGR